MSILASGDRWGDDSDGNWDCQEVPLSIPRQTPKSQLQTGRRVFWAGSLPRLRSRGQEQCRGKVTQGVRESREKRIEKRSRQS